MNRRTILAAGAAVAATTRVPRAAQVGPIAKPNLVLTGDMGNVAGRLGWLSDDWQVAEVDKKRGIYQDLALRVPGGWASNLVAVKCVVHCAAHLGGGLDAIMEDSIDATANLLAALSVFSPKAHIVFTSSVWAMPGTWGHKGSVDGPEGWYGWSKRAIEEMLRVHVASTGGSAAVIRLGSVPPVTQDMPARLAALDANGWPREVLMSEAEIEQAFRLALVPVPNCVRVIDLHTVRGPGAAR